VTPKVPPVVNLLFNAIGFIQVPGEMCSVLYRPELIKRPFLASPIGRLDIYLGYPCYLVDPKDFAVTKGNLGIEARSYIGFVRTARESDSPAAVTSRRLFLDE
jgi:hypothetical protein